MVGVYELCRRLGPEILESSCFLRLDGTVGSLSPSRLITIVIWTIRILKKIHRGLACG
jgi:hypothetical protein